MKISKGLETGDNSFTSEEKIKFGLTGKGIIFLFGVMAAIKVSELLSGISRHRRESVSADDLLEGKGHFNSGSAGLTH